MLVVTPWYKPTVGGVAEVAERLSRWLARSGIETHVLVCDDAASKSRIARDPVASSVWRLHVTGAAFTSPDLRTVVWTAVWGAVAYWRLARFVKRFRIRTVIALYPIEYSWVFVAIRHTLGCRFIPSCHGNELTKLSQQPAGLRWLLRRVLRSADAVIVCAEHLKQAAEVLVPDRKLPVTTIPNCVDVEHFVPGPSARRPDAGPRLVHISNFAPKKRVLDIVAAFASAPIPERSRLVMVGHGPDHAAAVARSHELGVDHRIDFVGMQSDVRPFLREADLLVMASDDEGAPLVLLEAMACGVPWISPPWGVAGMVAPGECGLVVPPRSPHKLAAAIAELVNDPQRRQTMGRRARQRVETDFGIEAYVSRHLQVIRRVHGTDPISSCRVGIDDVMNDIAMRPFQ